VAESEQEQAVVAQLEALGVAAAVLDDAGGVRAATIAFRSLSPALADGCVGRPLEEALKQVSNDHTLCEGFHIYQINSADGCRWYREQRRTVSSWTVSILADVSLEWRLLRQQAVTSLSEAEALRREAADNARRLRMTLARTKAALYEGDFRFASTWTSPELPELAGPEAFSRFGDGTLNFFHPDDHETILVQRENDKAGRRILPSMVRLNRTDREFWVRVFREIERDPNGEPGRFLGIVIDSNEEKKQENELSRARAEAEAAAVAKSNFLASMSHEIRTPLNGVLGMAQALTADGLNEAQSEKVQIILDSGRTLMGLLNDVLDLSKIEAGKMEISCIDGDLASTLDRVRKLFLPKAEERGISLVLDPGEKAIPRLSYDPVRVNQCVSNLLSNAVKFTERGEVRMRLKVEPGEGGRNRVTISVSDTGIGMNAEAVSRLFSAFTQADASTSRRFGGTGLGLSITRQVARLMGGDVSAESVEGQGSTFHLTFLADPSTSAAKTEEAAAPALAGGSLKRFSGRRVLLVDDNAVNRMVVRLFLAPLGTHITEAENGVQALEKLGQEAFDIVLLDIHMPVMDGVECIGRIRSSGADWSSVAVLALTADAMSGDRERYLCMGMDDYVAKPIDQRELASKVAGLLARTMEVAPMRHTG
jgi:signal transduction histidine kinase/ActR/RegA family two-component response regulator